MKKKIVACLLALTLLLTLSACGTEGSIRRNRNVLTVCIDAGDNSVFLERDMYDFMYTFRQVTGIEEVEFIYLPKPGVERDTLLQRMRTELMSGAGPDVFIARCGLADNTLFPYPEKIMNNGFFLPLDDYMENNTEYTEWNRQEQVILAAGRNEEGQQLIPLSYSFAVQVHPKSELDIEKPDHPVTFEEALSDPALSALYSEFYNCRSVSETSDGDEFEGIWSGLAADIMGNPADFENEELTFTEEELLSVMKTIYSLPRDRSALGIHYDEIDQPLLLPNYDQPFTLLPLYTTNGGMCAAIGSFIAINRNTKRAEEAYTFLDFFMREKTQLKSIVFDSVTFGLPLFSDAYKEEYSHFGSSLTAEAFEELTETKEQITDVVFYTELSNDLARLFSDCWEAYKAGAPYEEMVHEAYELMQRKVKE